MAARDIVVVGASAGGVEALMGLVKFLPRGLPASLFVVLHVAPNSESVLPEILDRAGPLPAMAARDGMSVEPGRVVVAPPDHHLMLTKDAVTLTDGPRENGHRPAVDVLFRSAAVTYGPRVLGVVLSGSLDDGTAGLLAIKRRGGCALVQDPDEAQHAGMPCSAIENVQVDRVTSVAGLAEAIEELVATEVPEEGATMADDDADVEAEVARLARAPMGGSDIAGQPSGFVCPECNGALWAVDDHGLQRFRCRVGHAYGAESLLAGQSAQLETALWIAMRSLAERSALSRQLSERARARGHKKSAAQFEARADEADRSVVLLREALELHDNAQPDGDRSTGS